MYKTAKPENFESRWEYTKATSSWHFDKFKDEDREPPFKILGRFKEGAWQNEFDEILKNAKTTPVTFRTRLASGAEPYTMRLDDNDLAKMGLATSHALYSKLQLPSTAFWLGKMARFFQLSDPTVAFHIQYPGQVFPFHIDNLTGIRSNQHGHPVNFDPESVIRFEIQLKPIGNNGRRGKLHIINGWIFLTARQMLVIYHAV